MFCKLGLVFEEYAQLPTLEDRNESIRIYYSYRLNKQSYINYFELLKKNLKVKYKNKKSVMSPGRTGCFDDAGVMPSSIVNGNLFYTGWNLKSSVPYGHAIGHAFFNENKNKFERIDEFPILDRGRNVPFLANSPFVIEDRMWFSNGSGWDGNFAKYNIWQAKKINNNWIVKKHLFGGKNEAYSRVCFSRFGFLYSKKRKNTCYEIFLHKNGKNKKVIPRSTCDNWDFEMTCYPYFFKDMVFYNGNGYGKTGVGVAKLL